MSRAFRQIAFVVSAVPSPVASVVGQPCDLGGVSMVPAPTRHNVGYRLCLRSQSITRRASKRTADPTRKLGMRPAFAILNTVFRLMFSISASCLAVSAPFMPRAIGVTDRHRKVAHGILVDGKPIRTTMLDAGYSHASANQGLARIRRSVPLAAAYAQEVERLKNSPVPPAEARAQIVRTKLLENVANNCDNAVQSLKLLGQDRELSLWQPEVQQGLIILNVPAALQDPEERRRMLEAPEE